MIQLDIYSQSIGKRKARNMGIKAIEGEWAVKGRLGKPLESGD